MTPDEILNMAREAGFVEYELEDYTATGYDVRFERFAALVAAAEREACAKLCEQSDRYRGDYFASIIRARSKQ